MTEFEIATSYHRPRSTARRSRIGIKHLLLATACCALSCSALASWPSAAARLAAVAGVIAVILVAVSIQRRSGWGVVCAIAILTPFGVLRLSFPPPAPSVAGTGNDEYHWMLGCNENLRTIQVALKSYYDDYGSMPPAYVQGLDGKRMHSWRVLILPYLGWQDLYSQYRSDEPWDGPHNRLLHGTVPDVYRCPAEESVQESTTTSYVAVVGPTTPWPGSQGRKDVCFRRCIPTILVVEMADSGIHWMEPRDLKFEDARWMPIGGVGEGLRSKHGGGCAHVVYTQGVTLEVTSRWTVNSLHEELDALRYTGRARDHRPGE